MSIINYAKKLINDNVLICESRLNHPHVVHKLWAPDFMESITFIAANRSSYHSTLHFFWQTIFHQREVTNQQQADEIISITHLHQLSLNEVHEKIKRRCPHWYAQHNDLLPQAKWAHVIWEDDNDLFMIFEDEDQYFAWNWDSMAQ